MKRFTSIHTLSLLFLLACTVMFAPSVGAQEASQFKIGVVDLKIVFDNYGEQKKRYEELSTERDKLQKPITELSDQITKDKERYEEESPGMSEADRKTMQDRIQSDFSRYKAEVQQSQEEIDRREKRIFEDLIVNIQKAVEEVGSIENYHLVFDGSKNRNNNLLYYSTTLNMTQKVIDHLNAE